MAEGAILSVCSERGNNVAARAQTQVQASLLILETNFRLKI
jgi:hypothetical protein